MNYFAHGRNYLEDPYLLAGTAVPDWLSVVDRGVRARRRLARPWVHATDPRVAAVARGIVQHHTDDAWFHRTRAFAELSLDFTVEIRARLAPDTGFRPSFLGHILVEILLDAALIEQAPSQLDAYYEAVTRVDPLAVGRAVSRMATGSTQRLPLMITRFCQEQFLYDYRSDQKLLGRLNRVMCRVRLPELPPSFSGFFREARRAVDRRMDELLVGETISEPGERS